MAKVRVYVRVARKAPGYHGSCYAVDAKTTADPRPLTQGDARSQRQLQTIRFALDLSIPDEMFNPAQWPTIEVELPDGERLPIVVEAVAEEAAA